MNGQEVAARILAVVIGAMVLLSLSGVLFPLVLLVAGVPGLILLSNWKGKRSVIVSSRVWGWLPWIRSQPVMLIGVLLVLWAGVSTALGAAIYVPQLQRIGAAAATATPTATPTATETSTPEPTDTSVPTVTPQPTATATPAPTNTQVAPAAVAVSGGVPRIQFVGVVISAELRIRNTGPAIPHLVLDVGGATDHWVLNEVDSDSAYGASKSDHGDYYDLGRLGGGERVRVTLYVVPKDAGNHNFDVGVYGEDSGYPDRGIPLSEPLESLRAAVAINP